MVGFDFLFAGIVLTVIGFFQVYRVDAILDALDRAPFLRDHVSSVNPGGDAYSGWTRSSYIWSGRFFIVTGFISTLWFVVLNFHRIY